MRLAGQFNIKRGQSTPGVQPWPLQLSSPPPKIEMVCLLFDPRGSTLDRFSRRPPSNASGHPPRGCNPWPYTNQGEDGAPPACLSSTPPIPIFLPLPLGIYVANPGGGDIGPVGTAQAGPRANDLLVPRPNHEEAEEGKSSGRGVPRPDWTRPGGGRSPPERIEG